MPQTLRVRRAHWEDGRRRSGLRPVPPRASRASSAPKSRGRVERDQIDVLPLDQRRDDALRRHSGNAGNAAIRCARSAGKVCVGGLHGEQACGDVHQRPAGDRRRDRRPCARSFASCLATAPSRRRSSQRRCRRRASRPAPRSIARSRRRPTFCAAKRISSQRSCRDIPLPSANGRYSPTRTSLASLIFMLR